MLLLGSSVMSRPCFAPRKAAFCSCSRRTKMTCSAQKTSIAAEESSIPTPASSFEADFWNMPQQDFEEKTNFKVRRIVAVVTCFVIVSWCWVVCPPAKKECSFIRGIPLTSIMSVGRIGRWVEIWIGVFLKSCFWTCTRTTQLALSATKRFKTSLLVEDMTCCEAQVCLVLVVNMSRWPRDTISAK